VLSPCHAIHLALGMRGLAGLAGLARLVVTFARLRSLDQRPVWLRQRTVGVWQTRPGNKDEQKTKKVRMRT
jgi:hypothetical protein